MRSKFLNKQFAKIPKQPTGVLYAYKKGVLRKCPKFTGKHLYESLFFNEIAGLRQFFEMFQITFLKNTSSCRFSQLPDFPTSQVDTQRRFNFYKTSIQRRRHRIDVL